jgi:hypothetical protein
MVKMGGIAMAFSKRGKQTAVPLHDPDQMKKIAEMAHHLWEKRGRPHGSDQKDWFEAEEIVMGRKP